MQQLEIETSQKVKHKNKTTKKKKNNQTPARGLGRPLTPLGASSRCQGLTFALVFNLIFIFLIFDFDYLIFDDPMF